MSAVFRVLTDEEIANSDPMIKAQCSASVYGGKRRCRNLSEYNAQSLLLDENGRWFCAYHSGSPVYEEKP